MRGFVIGTGRCGTLTCSRALSHATNYTVGHESHSGCIGDWVYPDGHIEVSAGLTIAFPLLQQLYPASRWIWLVRTDRRSCVESIASMNDGRPVREFCGVFFHQRKPFPIMGAEAIYDLLNALAKRSGAYKLKLETAKEQWAEVWELLGCEGDYPASLREWDVRYNRASPRQPVAQRGRAKRNWRKT